MAASQSYSPPSSMTPHTSSVHYHPPMPESITTLALTSSSGASPTTAQTNDSNDLKRKRSRWGQTPSAMQQVPQSQSQPQPQPQNPSTSLTASYSPPSSASSPPSSVSSTSFSSTRQVYSSSYIPTSSHTSSSLPTSPHTSSSSSPYARGTSSNTISLSVEKNRNFSPAPQPARQFKKYSDTYKPGMIRVGSKWVYPEDEITEGGTWEHKKRAEEMKKTAGRYQ